MRSRANHFRGTASFYSRFRPDYPAALWDRLSDEACLNPSSVVLDLGCGAGAAALALAHKVAQVVGVDADRAMLSEAARLAEARGVENVRWVCSRAEEFNESLENLALIVVASAFHWMDRKKVAELGRKLLRPAGVFAVTGNPNPILQIRKREGVGAAIAEVQDRWFGESAELSPAALDSIEEVLQRGHFASVVHFEIPTQQSWTVQRLLGFLRSTSSRPDQRLGTRYPEFAAEVERAILSVEPTGRWTLNGVVSVVLART